MRVLVTGCAGFVGSHLARRLLAEGYHVVGVDNFADYYPRHIKASNIADMLADPRFEFHELDLVTANLLPLLADVEIVYHQAAQAGVRASWGAQFESYLRNNVLATQRLLELLKALPIRKFVYASSSSVYGDAESYPTHEDMVPRPVSPYGVTKLAAEQLTYLYWKNYGVPTIALRYFTVYGPGQRPDMAFHKFIASALHGRPIQVYGDGHQTRDFTFISDVVEANIAAGLCEAAGIAVNVGGGSRVTVRQVLAILQEILGRELLVEYTAPQHGDVRHTAADISLANRVLGYEPRVSLREGLEAEVRWLEAQLALVRVA